MQQPPQPARHEAMGGPGAGGRGPRSARRHGISKQGWSTGKDTEYRGPFEPNGDDPARAVVPGRRASCSRKWLQRVCVRDERHDGPKLTDCHEVRATDGAGRMQPAVTAWKPKGYRGNSTHRIVVSVA